MDLLKIFRKKPKTEYIPFPDAIPGSEEHTINCVINHPTCLYMYNKLKYKHEKTKIRPNFFEPD